MFKLLGNKFELTRRLFPPPMDGIHWCKCHLFTCRAEFHLNAHNFVSKTTFRWNWKQNSHLEHFMAHPDDWSWTKERCTLSSICPSCTRFQSQQKSRINTNPNSPRVQSRFTQQEILTPSSQIGSNLFKKFTKIWKLHF